MALADLRQGYKNQAWFDANPTLVLKEGQVVHLLQTGTYKIGNGSTTLSALAFLGGGGSGGTNNLYEDQAWFDSNTTYVLEEGQVAFLEQTGRYKLGDGVTQLQTLAFLGSGGGVRFDSNTAGFPVTGEIEVIYVAKDTGLMYQWNGVTYVELSASSAETTYSFQPIISGVWRTVPFTGNAGSLANTTGILLFIPYYVDKDHYVTEIGLYLLAGATGGTIRLALYSKDATSGQAATLIEDSGNITATSSGQKSFSFASPRLMLASEKVYYLGYQANANGISVRSTTSWLTNVYDGAAGVSNARIQFGSYGAFPSTVTPTSQTGNAILVSLKPQ